MERKILIVDDEPEVANSLISALKRRKIDFDILYTDNQEEAKKIFATEKPQVAILDLTIDINIGPESGLSLLSFLFEIDPTCRFLVLTGHNRVEQGMEALNRGALTYLEKPGNPDLILALINDGIELATFKREVSNKNKTNTIYNSLIGTKMQSNTMKNVIEKIDFAIQTNLPVLITGETGTGKGLLARIIHKYSSRKKYPFIRYQPSFTNTDLITSELFGHKKGSFTGANDGRNGLLEEANHGTLFIDEIDALPKETQVLLLEALQEKTFRKIGSSKEIHSNFRLITALNKKINEVLESNLLRHDFYHRIAHFIIDLPPLRERIEDIDILTENIISRLCEKEDLDIAHADNTSIHKLRQHNWPGNIRELQAVVEGAAYRATIRGKKFISADDIKYQHPDTSSNSLDSLSFREKINSYEEQIVCKALKNAKGNQALAAKELQMDRTVFRRILSRVEG